MNGSYEWEVCPMSRDGNNSERKADGESAESNTSSGEEGHLSEAVTILLVTLSYPAYPTALPYSPFRRTLRHLSSELP